MQLQPAPKRNKPNPYPTDREVKSHPQTPVRMHPDIKARLQRTAEADGYRHLSTWMRHQAIARADDLGIE